MPSLQVGPPPGDPSPAVGSRCEPCSDPEMGLGLEIDSLQGATALSILSSGQSVLWTAVCLSPGKLCSVLFPQLCHQALWLPFCLTVYHSHCIRLVLLVGTTTWPPCGSDRRQPWCAEQGGASPLCVCVGGGALGYLSLWRCISSVPWQSWWPRSLRADPLVCVHHMLGALLCCVYGVLPVQLPVSDPGCPWLLLVTAVRPSPCSSALGTGLEVVKFCSDACHLLSGLTCLCTQAGSTGLSQGGVPSPAASQNSRESRNSSFPGLESLSHGSGSA